MVIDFKEEHSSNAHTSIVVTLFGIVIDVKEEHQESAPPPIVVIPSDMITFLINSCVPVHG